MVIKEINSINNNFYFSKCLKDIDISLKFKEFAEEKSFSRFNKIKKEQKERSNMLKRKNIHNEIIYNLKKAYNDYQILANMKDNNIKEKPNKNKEILPKLVIKSNKETENKNSNINNKKGNNNDNNDKNKDNKEQVVEFDNIWKKEYLNRMKKRKNNSNIVIYNANNESDEKNDIFDIKYKKKAPKKLFKSKIIEKIKNYNLKVKKKLKDYKNHMDKFSEKKEYNPNFTALEKHIPIVKLNTKSQRIFPDQFIKMHNYSDEKKIFKKKLIKNNSAENITRNNYNISPCSLFNSSIKYNSIINELYNTIYKSIANKVNISEYLFKGPKTKSHSLLETGNIIYEI